MFVFCVFFFCLFVFFQAEDGIRDLVRSRGLGDVYKRQEYKAEVLASKPASLSFDAWTDQVFKSTLLTNQQLFTDCLLYTSDAADERSSVDLGGRRIIKKKKNIKNNGAFWATLYNSHNKAQSTKYT